MNYRLVGFIVLFATVASLTIFGQLSVNTKNTLDKLFVVADIAETSTNLTLDTSYSTLVVTGTNAVTVTLPDASAVFGKAYTIKSASLANVVVSNSTDLIDGQTSYTIGQVWQAVTLQSAGSTNWYVIGEVR